MKKYDNTFVRKIRAIYGTRASLKLTNDILPFRTKQSMRKSLLDQNKKKEDEAPVEKILWYKLLIISPEAQWKSMFDLWVLLFVGYSCIWNVLYFAFPINEDTKSFKRLKLFNNISESIFYADFVLSFF